jgi:hypothetical protein
MNNAIRKQKILEKKQASETELLRRIQKSKKEAHNLHLFSSLELNYKNRRAAHKAMSYFVEAFLNGSELIQLAFEILNLDLGADKEFLAANVKKILKQYSNLDPDVDKEVFMAMLKEYRLKVDTVFLPEMYHSVTQEYGGNAQAFVDSLYARTELITPSGLERLVEKDSTYNVFDDPAISVGIDLIVKYYEMNQTSSEYSANIERDERELNAIMRRVYADRNFYPDANSTMRLSFGTVESYSPFDGVEYNYYTTVKGILEKARTHSDDPDFAVEPRLATLLTSKNYGHYADAGSEMTVCFISNNDITGGNSGSAMFNGKGELIGLAFDGNWEAMSGDIIFEPRVQRCIGVDVRYILFIIEKYGEAEGLIKEMKLLGINKSGIAPLRN